MTPGPATWCLECRAGRHNCGGPFCECARAGHGATLDPSGLVPLLQAPGIPSQVQALALFDPGDPTPPPRRPAPQHPGQGALL